MQGFSVSHLGSSTQFPLRAGAEGPVEETVIIAAAGVGVGVCHGESASHAFTEHISTIKAHQIRSSTENIDHWSHRFWKRNMRGPIPRRNRPEADPPPLQGSGQSEYTYSLVFLSFLLALESVCFLWVLFAGRLHG